MYRLACASLREASKWVQHDSMPDIVSRKQDGKPGETCVYGCAFHCICLSLISFLHVNKATGECSEWTIAHNILLSWVDKES